MSFCIIDIETAPLSEEEQQPYEPQFEPSAKLKEPEVDMPPAKLGRLVDPDKIAKAEADHAARWEAEQLARAKAIADDVLAKRRKWLDGAQLDAMRCRICAAGVKWPDDYPYPVTLYGVGDAHSESDIISDVWAVINTVITTSNQVAGHNLTGYDLPMLEQRSAILGIPIPRGIRARNRKFYNTDKFIDTLELWPKKLDLIGKALGIGGKPGDMSGKDFWKADEATQREYLTWDLKACAEIVKRFGGEGAE